MNVLLLHIDGKLPNLALMRLHAYHRALGHHVQLRRLEDDDGRAHPEELHPRLGDPIWDRVHGSLIFERSKPIAHEARRVYPDIDLGGTGWSLASKLPSEAEDIAPDYSGYPLYTPSIGFTQRGCRLKCTFCVVPRKEGKNRSVSTLRGIWRGGEHAKQVVLLDNDFFGNPNWRDVIAEAREDDIAIAVIQGINARALKEEQASAIASVKWMAGDFSRRRVYTAWDHGDDEAKFFRGLELLKAHGISPDSMLVYMLIGYEPGETHADRDHRRRRLREFGARPYPMAFTREGELGAELVAFQSWCTQRHDEHIPWEVWWGKVRGNVRKLGTRRVSLPLFEGA